MKISRPEDGQVRCEVRLLGLVAARMHRLVVAAAEKTYQEYPSDQEGAHRTRMRTESLGHLRIFVLGGEESSSYEYGPNRSSRDGTGDQGPSHPRLEPQHGY